MIRALSYENVLIRLEPDKSEGCLTDMYRAYRAAHLKGGGTEKDIEHKRPAQWLRISTVIEFREYVRVNFNGGVDPIWTQQGNGGGTWGHWQMVMAYGTYLSEAVHAWVNSAARMVMEGVGVVDAPAALPPAAPHFTPDQKLEMGGIVKTVTRPLRDGLEALKDRFDTRIAPVLNRRLKTVTGKMTAHEAVLAAGVTEPKGRHRINRKFQWHLDRWATMEGIPFDHDGGRPNGTHLYDADMVRRFLAAYGYAWAAEHNRSLGAQMDLPLSPPRRRARKN